VQLLVRLVATPGGVPELLHALRSVMRPAQQTRGCSFAQIYQCANDERRIEYMEEWDDAKELREEFRSERFVRLLTLLETAAERPVVEFRTVSKIRGLEYIADSESAPSLSSGD
jgi:quinol monooxygenase YgiN